MISCEIANFVRNAQFYLKFTLPSTKESKSTKVAPSVDDLEALIENKYLKYCNPQIPLHLISSCMSRGFIGKWRVGEYLFNNANNLVSQPVEYRDKIFFDAIQTIECDTAVYMTSITKGFLWFTKYHLPFPAYSYLIQELRRSTTGEYTERAWQAIALNFEERDMFSTNPKSKIVQNTLPYARQGLGSSRKCAGGEARSLRDSYIYHQHTIEICNPAAEIFTDRSGEHIVGFSTFDSTRDAEISCF